jgi:hypothetical protein
MLVLNVAAVVGLYKFLFTRGPLWMIWNSSKIAEWQPIPESEDLVSPNPATTTP